MKIVAKSSTEKFTIKQSDYQFDRYECAVCRIRYSVPKNADTGCPLCRAYEARDELEQIHVHMHEELERAAARVNALAMVVDHYIGMQVAVDTMPDEELKSVQALVDVVRENDLERDGYATLGIMFRKASESPVGFVLNRYEKESVELRLGSVGGIALVTAFMNANRVHGEKKATEMILAAVPYHSEWDAYVD